MLRELLDALTRNGYERQYERNSTMNYRRLAIVELKKLTSDRNAQLEIQIRELHEKLDELVDDPTKDFDSAHQTKIIDLRRGLLGCLIAQADVTFLMDPLWRMLTRTEVKELRDFPEARRERLIRDYQEELQYSLTHQSTEQERKENPSSETESFREALTGLLSGDDPEKWNY